MPNKVPTKLIYKSKVFWFNTASAMIAYLAVSSELIREGLAYIGLTPAHTAFIVVFLNAINIALRFSTDTKAVIKRNTDISE